MNDDDMDALLADLIAEVNPEPDEEGGGSEPIQDSEDDGDALPDFGDLTLDDGFTEDAPKEGAGDDLSGDEDGGLPFLDEFEEGLPDGFEDAWEYDTPYPEQEGEDYADDLVSDDWEDWESEEEDSSMIDSLEEYEEDETYGEYPEDDGDLSTVDTEDDDEGWDDEWEEDWEGDAFATSTASDLTGEDDDNEEDKTREKQKHQGGNNSSGNSPLDTIKGKIASYFAAIKSEIGVQSEDSDSKEKPFVPKAEKDIEPKSPVLTRKRAVVTGVIVVSLVLFSFYQSGKKTPSEFVYNFPDGGQVTLSSFANDGGTVTADAMNTGRVIARGTPRALIYGKGVNPVTWFSPDLVKECPGEYLTLQIGEVKKINVSCSQGSTTMDFLGPK